MTPVNKTLPAPRPGRLRARYRELVRAEVASLVDDPAEVDDEIAHLMRALSG